MPEIVQEKGGTVLWSRVYCMSDIVYLSPLQMLCTTTPFLGFYGLATCLPVVLTGLNWLLMIGIGFVKMTLLIEEFMDAALCGRFKLALKFKLFTIVVSIPGPCEIFLFFV